MYLIEQKSVIQSCDRPINTICRRQQKAAVSTPAQRKEKILAHS